MLNQCLEIAGSHNHTQMPPTQAGQERGGLLIGTPKLIQEEKEMGEIIMEGSQVRPINEMDRQSFNPENICTFVIPKTPILGLEEVEPFPVPNMPSRTQERPSTKIPLKVKKWEKEKQSLKGNMETSS